MIRFEAVTKRFDEGGQPAVDTLDLEVEEGAITVLVGPSGCGKTTSLRMINRLEDPSEGRILVNGRDIMATDRTQLRRGIGYVMQSSGLFPHRTVRDNIATVPRLLGWSRERIDTRVRELVDLVGLLPEILPRYPHSLSGGQQQRVGVARALAADPPVMLMDEPFAAVDPVVRAHLQDEFLRLQKRVGKTIVFVTHDIDEAIKIGDRIAVFMDGGRLAQYATPVDLLAEPANDFVVGFLGGDRELRRLALVPVDRVEPERGPAVRLDDAPETARGIARDAQCTWLVVLDQADRLQGWIAVDALTGRSVGEGPVQTFKYTVSAGDSMRSALNAMVASSIGVAPRVDGEGHYEGLLTRRNLTGTLS